MTSHLILCMVYGIPRKKNQKSVITTIKMFVMFYFLDGERNQYQFVNILNTVAGGSISDTGSHSSCLQANARQLSLSATSDALHQAEPNSTLSNREGGEETIRVSNSPKQMFLAAEPQICMVNTCGNYKPDTKSNAVSPKFKDTTSSPLKQSKEVKDNPSKIQSHNFAMPSLPQMPCVSTTGNGPNGKTITGFLYRYTKAEISIVCVCHGSSFSPAEFVEHAGGIDITHPLRHITMIPSSFR